MRLARSSWSARRLLRSLDLDVVVATGAYVSAPAAVAARSLRLPLLLLEPNARPGLANRWLSRVATVAATAFDTTASEMHCRCRVTGVPVRRGFFENRQKAPDDAHWRVLVLGGSQGAADLNRRVPEALATVAASLDRQLQVLHQAGRGKEEETREVYSDVGLPAEVVSFLDDVPSAMAAADLVLSRSGAVTLAEIAEVCGDSLTI